MTKSVQTLTFRFVNAYLVKVDDGFVLIDTGFRSDRKTLDQALADEGCGPGDLRLIVITHGDPDHTSNAAYLRATLGAKIAMHRAEAVAVEKGDMFLSRGPMPLSRRMMKPLMSLFALRKRDRFIPDLFVEDGDSLAEFGCDVSILHVPGHSKGSIAVLTAKGELFCGDFFENRKRPSLATLVDDAKALQTSFERVKTLNIQTVYPGHGGSFPFNELR